MSEGKIKINGVNYAYRWLQRTSPMRPTIICLHGFTGTSMSFSLPFQDLNVLAIDLIGHGKTDVYVHPYRYKLPLLVQDLAQLVLQLKIDAFYLLGYSMGARTALTWLIEQPKGILGIIMESGTPGISSVSERLIRQKKDLLLAQKIMTEPLSGFVDYWKSIPLFESQKELPDSTRRKIRQGRLMQQPIGLALSLMYMGAGQQTNYWPSLRNIQRPILYLAGEYDDKFQKIGKKLVEENSLFSMALVPKSGHCIHLEQPTKFVSLVNQWIMEKEKSDTN